MIIHSLRAQNVLKYARLELCELPEKGIIAISGRNESGKTALAETICFALFGRAFSHRQDAARQIIRWSAADCQAELRFSARRDGGAARRYRITRSLDDKGTHAAQIFRADEQSPYATGPRAVEAAVQAACGFDFSQYLDAVYMAQREISAPRPNTDTIKSMAGVADLEAAAAALAADAEAQTSHIADTEREIDALLARIAALEPATAAAADLEQKAQAARQQAEQARQARQDLEAVAADIQAHIAPVQTAGRALANAGVRASLKSWGDMLDAMRVRLAALRATCAGAETEATPRAQTDGLTAQLDDFAGRVNDFAALDERITAYRAQLATLLGEGDTHYTELSGEPPLPRQHRAARGEIQALTFKRLGAQTALFTAFALTVLGALTWWHAASGGLGVIWLRDFFIALFDAPPPQTLWPGQAAAAAFGALALGAVFVAARLERRLKARKQHAADLQTRMDDLRARAALLDRAYTTPVPQLVAALARLGNEGINRQLKIYTDGRGAPFVDAAALAAQQDRLVEAQNATLDSVDDLRRAVAADAERERRRAEDARARLAALDAERQQLQERADAAAQLREEINALAAQKAQQQEQREVLGLARQLCLETCRGVYKRFNAVLGQYTGAVIPRLTGERYRQMQISDDLVARVFCQDKNDFADLAELSSGTQGQIMLALRLSLAKALVEIGGLGEQFIVLDEPFAFFDRERAREALQSLPRADKHLRQIWLIGQEFDDTRPFHAHIICSRDSDELVVQQSAADKRIRSRA